MSQHRANSIGERTILVCCGTGCQANGSMAVYQAFRKELADSAGKVRAYAKSTGCNGWCEKGPLVKILPDDITYCRVKAEDVPEIVASLRDGGVVERLLYRDPVTKKVYRSHRDTNFYKKQMKIALRNIGEIDPANIRDYLDRGGYTALRKALKMSPAEVI
ncbi:MAG: NAD(P)H-dependent oxidoreductase subunit E, partial [Thermacetogeniaceae bacterium]